jgi:predicted Zn-dependent protease
MSMDLRRLLEAAAPKGADWAGLRRVRLSGRGYFAKDGRFDRAMDSEDEGFMMEVLAEGQFGYACFPGSGAFASDLVSRASSAARQALSLARSASGRALHRFSDSVRPPSRIRWESPRGKRAPLGADFLSGQAIELTKALKVGDKIVQATAGFFLREEETEIVSTSGAEIHQSVHILESSLMALARDGNIVQRRSANGPRGRTLMGGMELVDVEAGLEDARRIGGEAIELLTAEECPSMTADLVLAPDQMAIQIHESVGHPLELDRILGDERNFAGWSFVRPSDIGSLRYGSELMNVSFDPGVPGEAASYGADDIGNPARREYIVKDGILVRALGSLESQERSGLPGVANQRAQGWWRSPIDRMANLNIEPGKDSLEDILASIESGVFMTTNRSWSIDDRRNKFQFGCEYGRRIEAGRLGGLLRNPNYRGISSSFWKSLFKVGDPSTFEVYGTPNCGKGEPSQIVTTGHASPVCAFRGVEIFGGEA